MAAPSPGTLFIVATPIGNLEDITLRALRVLREVDLVAAEDTRRTGNLLRHYQIPTSILSLHEHNEHRRAEQLIGQLNLGRSIALVSDAGTPGISDPGADLVRQARAQGLRVEPVPGPSAVTAVLSASGLPAERFVFGGFPPAKGRARADWFDWVARQTKIPVVCFEAPHRIIRTLEEMGTKLVNRPIVLARELTKIHEQWLQGLASELIPQLGEGRGEFVLLIAPAESPALPVTAPSDFEVARVFGQTTDNSALSRREGVKRTAASLGLSAKAVYVALERHKISGK